MKFKGFLRNIRWSIDNHLVALGQHTSQMDIGTSTMSVEVAAVGDASYHRCIHMGQIEITITPITEENIQKYTKEENGYIYCKVCNSHIEPCGSLHSWTVHYNKEHPFEKDIIDRGSSKEGEEG